MELPGAVIAYLDSSALAKLVVEEPESDPLRRWVERCDGLVSSALARTELRRAARRSEDPRVERRVGPLLASMALIPLDGAILDAAGLVEPLVLRSLDAIHVASARSLGAALGTLVSYDKRMLSAAEQAGLRTLAPAISESRAP